MLSLIGTMGRPSGVVGIPTSFVVKGDENDKSPPVEARESGLTVSLRDWDVAVTSTMLGAGGNATFSFSALGEFMVQNGPMRDMKDTFSHELSPTRWPL